MIYFNNVSIFIAGPLSIILEIFKAHAAPQSLGQWPRRRVQSPRRHSPSLLHSSLPSFFLSPGPNPPPTEGLPSRGLAVEELTAGPLPPPASADNQEGFGKHQEIRVGLLAHH